MDTFGSVVRIFKQIQESPNLFDHVGSAKIDLGVALLKGSKKGMAEAQRGRWTPVVKAFLAWIQTMDSVK